MKLYDKMIPNENSPFPMIIKKLVKKPSRGLHIRLLIQWGGHDVSLIIYAKRHHRFNINPLLCLCIR